MLRSALTAIAWLIYQQTVFISPEVGFLGLTNGTQLLKLRQRTNGE